MGRASFRSDEAPRVVSRHSEKITVDEHERLMQEQAHGYELQLLALRKEAGLLPTPEPKQPEPVAETPAPVELSAQEPQPDPEPEKDEEPADTTPETPVVERPMQGVDSQHRHKGGKRKHRR